MSKDNQDGNDTVKNIKENVEGIGEVTADFSGEKVVKIEIPQNILGMGAEAVEKYKAKVLDINAAGTKTYQERMNFNREQADRDAEKASKATELAETNRKLVEANRKLAEFQNTTPAKELNRRDFLAEACDEERPTDADLTDLLNDNPTAYYDALDKYDKAVRVQSREESDRVNQRYSVSSSLDSQIRNDGYDAAVVEGFYLENGFTDKSKAYRIFKQINNPPTVNRNTPKPSLAEQMNQARIDGRSIQFIEAGDSNEGNFVTGQGIIGMSKAQIDALPDAEFTLRYNHDLAKTK